MTGDTGFETTIAKGSPFMTPLPHDVLTRLATQPEQINDKAYLVLFYGVMLTSLSADPNSKEEDRTKLKWNLWLAMNDARLFLEPRDLHIQALLLLVVHVQDFHTPSLCWMMAGNACRMLLAMGITSHSLSDTTKERRAFIFWTLHSLDIALALVFGRPATFPLHLLDEVPMPTLRSMVSLRPHLDPHGTNGNGSRGETPSLYGAHTFHFMHVNSKILADVWLCIFDPKQARLTTDQVLGQLDSWYEEASTVCCSFRQIWLLG